MIKFNKFKKGCKDVFNSYMLENAIYTDSFEIPIINNSIEIPSKLVPFSKIRQVNDKNAWIHFYEHDYIINRIWNNPYKYLDLLRKFKGVILPDFSTYRDMPLILQIYNIYRSRVIGNWLFNNNIKFIVNIRFGDYRTYEIACSGILNSDTVSLGTHGTMKNKADRSIIENGMKYLLENLKPKNIIIYGTVNNSLLSLCKASKTNLFIFKSDFSLTHKHEKDVK